MNIRRFIRWATFGLLVAITPLAAWGQQAREEKTHSLTYHGVRANAQTKAENHTMNRNPNLPGWGGCVPSSVRTAALHAGVPREKVDAFWQLAQRRVGVTGTTPDMLAAMLQETMPGEKWISYVGDDPSVPDRLSAKGYCLGGTMAWGAPELYGNRRIAHMVDYDHFDLDGDLACVEDNNDPPGVYRWMTAEEASARIFAGGQGWVFAFTRLPATAQVSFTILAAALLFVAGAAMLGGLGLLPQPEGS